MATNLSGESSGAAGYLLLCAALLIFGTALAQNNPNAGLGVAGVAVLIGLGGAFDRSPVPSCNGVMRGLGVIVIAFFVFIGSLGSPKGIAEPNSPRRDFAAEKREAEKATLVALKKADPQKYLATLKASNYLLWLEELKTLDPAEFARLEKRDAEEKQRFAEEYKKLAEEYKKQQGKERAYELATRQRANPEEFLELKGLKWWKDGFDSVMMVSFNVKNPLQFDVKDIEITCRHSAQSGTEIDSNARVIYRVFPAKKTTAVREFNMGFIHSQAARSGCAITNAGVQ